MPNFADAFHSPTMFCRLAHLHSVLADAFTPSQNLCDEIVENALDLDVTLCNDLISSQSERTRDNPVASTNHMKICVHDEVQDPKILDVGASFEVLQERNRPKIAVIFVHPNFHVGDFQALESLLQCFGAQRSQAFAIQLQVFQCESLITCVKND